MFNVNLLLLFSIVYQQVKIGDLSTLFREDPAGENPVISELFNYERDSKYGPQHWGRRWNTCRGQDQSPIYINTTDVVHGVPYGILYNEEVRYMPGDLVNNGHSSTFFIDPKTRYLFGAPHVPDDVFVLSQIHLHFGNDMEHGSEHCLDGVYFPVEAHLVHYNVKYGDVRNASKQTDGLAAIGVFIKVGMGPFNCIDRFILQNFNDIKMPNKTGVKAIFNPSCLLPYDRRFYTYQGSKTTPPCNANIRWIVLRQTMTISLRSFLTLRSLRDKKGNRISLHGNFRPVQPIGCRVVEANF